MRVYTLTELGKRLARTKDSDSLEMRVLNFLYDNKSSTEEELYVVGGERHVMRHLVERGLVKELTT